MDVQFAPAPVVQRANTLKNAHWYAGTLVNVLVDGEQTNGRYAQCDITTRPGCEPPIHTHTREDEAFYLLDGTVRFTVGEHVLTAKTGDYVLLPKGIPHSFQVLSESARIILTVSPAGFENYFRHPLTSKPAPTLALPPAPQGPPPAEAIQTMVKLLEQEFGVIM
ncbi:cupin domain-containing protein [Spirosoma taeanense]|uniref:Cupin domain-containing protein n=1 Tax=Spirosoma taeanense TaxID=2735870 RepID=A0A6M5Y3L9_9BACT|nr:cupin domain-containing protein [Spirosoma taeanense]QJW89178.1 cupin domain-containing protein [Spirosoma taeanense]